MMGKYNYVILGGPEFYEYAYADILELPNVVYYKDDWQGFNTSFSRIILRANFNDKVNRIIKAPFSKYVYPRLFPFHFDEDRPLVFLFFNCRYSLLNSSYVEFLKQRYPSAKFVLYFQDIIKSNPHLNIERYRRLFDLLLSYDEGDCNQYGLQYFPTPYSRVKIPQNRFIEPFDVYFCGKAKNRYQEILNVHNRCVMQGLTCKFFLFGMEKDKMVSGEGIKYERSMSYNENLQYVQKCRCILEIMQQGATGFTPRLWEALTYGKHIISNNPGLKGSKYSEAPNVHQIEELNSMHYWIREDVEARSLEKFVTNPIELINYIEAR